MGTRARIWAGLALATLLLVGACYAWQHLVLDGALWGAPPAPVERSADDGACARNAAIVRDAYVGRQQPPLLTVNCN
jgi:hypothetical protein